MLGTHDLHELDLLELMLPKHAARILAVGTGLGPKARRVRRDLDRQLRRFEDRLAHEVRQGHLGGRNQIETACAVHCEQLARELRQLARAEQRVLVDEIRHVGLGISMLARMQIEHELSQGAVQPGQAAA